MEAIDAHNREAKNGEDYRPKDCKEDQEESLFLIYG
jgi:hypothetical protein